MFTQISRGQRSGDHFENDHSRQNDVTDMRLTFLVLMEISFYWMDFHDIGYKNLRFPEVEFC